MSLVYREPRIGFYLFETEGDLLPLWVHPQHHRVHDVSDRDDLRWMADMTSPRHLGDMHEPFDALLEFDKRAVVRNAYDFSAHLRTHRVLVLDALPWMRRELLETQRNPAPLLLIVEHLDPNVVPDRDQLRRMAHPAPRHVGNVQQAVHPSQIDECAEIGDVLDRTLPHLIHFEFGQDLPTLPFPLFLEDCPTGHDDIPSALVQFDDLEREHLADELIEVLYLPDIDLGTREKRIHREEIDDDSALDPTHQLPLDCGAGIVGLLDLVPDPHEVGLLLGQDDLALLIFDGFEVHLHLIPEMDLRPIAELHQWNRTFRFEPDVHHDIAISHCEHGARDDLALFEVPHRSIVQIEHPSVFLVGVLLLIEVLQRGRRLRRRWRQILWNSDLAFGFVSLLRSGITSFRIVLNIGQLFDSVLRHYRSPPHHVDFADLGFRNDNPHPIIRNRVFRISIMFLTSRSPSSLDR